MKKILALVTLAALTASAQPLPPSRASQAEANAGVNNSKYITPATMAGYTAGGFQATNGIKQLNGQGTNTVLWSASFATAPVGDGSSFTNVVNPSGNGSALTNNIGAVRDSLRIAGGPSGIVLSNSLYTTNLVLSGFTTVPNPLGGSPINVSAANANYYFANSYTVGLTAWTNTAWVPVVANGFALVWDLADTVWVLVSPTNQDVQGGNVLSLPGGGVTGAPVNTNWWSDYTTTVHVNGSSAFAGIAGTYPALPRVFKASLCGCALNANSLVPVDDAPALQAILDQSSNGPVELVIDGQAMILNSLNVHSNTTIRCAPGAGVKVGYHSTTAYGLFQHILYSDFFPHPAANISIIGGTWDGNCSQQGLYELGMPYETNPAHQVMGIFGFWFCGVSNLVVRDVRVINASYFAFLLQDCNGVMMDNCSALWPTKSLSGAADGLHFWGSKNVVINNFLSDAANDVIGINTDEGGYGSGGPSGTASGLLVRNAMGSDDPRLPYVTGLVTNIVINNPRFFGSGGTIKLWGYATTNAIADQIVIRDGAGTNSSYDMTVTPASGLKLGRVVVDNWCVSGHGGLNFDNAYASASLSHIALGTPITLGACTNILGDSSYVVTNTAPSSVTVGTTVPDYWQYFTLPNGTKVKVPAWKDH